MLAATVVAAHYLTEKVPECVPLAKEIHLHKEGVAWGQGSAQELREQAVVLWGLQQRINTLNVDLGYEPVIHLGETR